MKEYVRHWIKLRLSEGGGYGARQRVTDELNKGAPEGEALTPSHIGTVGKTEIGGGKVGDQLIEAVARTQFKGKRDDLRAAAEQWWGEQEEAKAGLYVVRESRRPTSTWGDVHGWAEAEAEARATYRRLAIPDRAWEGARTLQGPRPPRLTPEFVKSAALFWLEHLDE